MLEITLQLIVPIITLAGVVCAWYALRYNRQTQVELQLAKEVQGINEGFSRTGAVGPLLWTYMNEMQGRLPRDFDPKLAQDRIVLLLHHVNYFGLCHRHQKLLGPQWAKREEWFNKLVLKWVEADALLRWTVRYLVEFDDFQDPEYAAYFKKAVQHISRV